MGSSSSCYKAVLTLSPHKLRTWVEKHACISHSWAFLGGNDIFRPQTIPSLGAVQCPVLGPPLVAFSVCVNKQNYWRHTLYFKAKGVIWQIWPLYKCHEWKPPRDRKQQVVCSGCVDFLILLPKITLNLSKTDHAQFHLTHFTVKIE